MGTPAMDEGTWFAQQFEKNRGHLRGVAYRMLGSLSEADDAVQETWLRLSRSDAGNIQNLSGWLTTVAARVCSICCVRERPVPRSHWKHRWLRSRTSRVLATLNKRPSLPIRWEWHYSWYLTVLTLPNVWPSCCTTYSRSRSKRLL